MRDVFAAAALLLALQNSAALAADVTAPATEPFVPTMPQLSIVGSLSGAHTDNVLFSRDNRLKDVFAEPDISLRLDGKLAPDLSYRLYVRSAFDTFAEIKDGNEAFVLLGARVTKNIAGWNASAIYENRYEFEGIYRDRLFTANDVMASLARDFEFGDVILSPMVRGIYRFADLAEARRYRLDLLLGIEVRLTPRWSIVSTPFIEGYWFTDGLNSGRQDWIYSASLGLKYNIANNVSLTTTAAYETRTSNVADRHYRDFTIGPRLDFAF